MASLLDIFRRMVNDCITIGLSTNVASLKRLSILSWERRREYACPAYYKVAAVSRAAGILAARKKSLRRGIQTRDPYAVKPQLTAYQGFKIENDALRIPVGERSFQYIPLTKHTLSILSEPGLRVHSFTLTEKYLSINISRDTPLVECIDMVGVDRNLRNLTVGNEQRVVQYDLSKTIRIAETTARIVSSFKRYDVRIEKRISSKYGRRRRERTVQLLHNATKQIVKEALERRQAPVLENLEGIRLLYRKGKCQGPRYRGKMNGWSFGEAQRQVEYKARWAAYQ